MSVDVSPDGRQLVFDLLGDIYSLPASGGEAKRLTPLPKPTFTTAMLTEIPNRGQGFDSQPRFSPDGGLIAFISDRDGADNLYVMKPDGSAVRQLTTGRDDFSSPAWSPDGRFIAVRHRPRTAAAGEAGWGLWIYSRQGGTGYVVDTGKFKSPTGCEFARDDSAIYFSTPIKNSIFQIARKDRQSGRVVQLTQDFGGAVRPRISPDGRYMAYATFADGDTVLRLIDLATGMDRALVRGVAHDIQLHSSGLMDVFPGYAFSPDGRFIYLSFGGGIHRVSVTEKKVEDIPFHVKTTIEVGPEDFPRVKPLEGTIPVRMLEWTQYTPDGQQLVFEALGKIWIANADGSHVRRITNSSSREYQPAVSPDGKWVAYVTWSDSRLGELRKVPLAGGASVALTREPGLYINPSWSPDGTRIALAVGGGSELQDQETTHDLSRTLSWISSDGGELHTITTVTYPYVPTNNMHLHASVDIAGRFNRDGTRLWYMEGSELHSVHLDGSDDRIHLKLNTSSPYDVEDPPMFILSPDEQGVIFAAGNNDVWYMPMPWSTSEPVMVDIHGKTTPALKRVSLVGGYFPAWIGNDEFSYTFAGNVYRYKLSNPENVTETKVNLTAEVPSPKGMFAIRGARLITMNGDRVIDRGTIVVKNNRIAAVGPTAQVRIPEGATIMDGTGKTIMPGLIDVHDHILGGSSIRIWPEQDRFMAAALAYGVTTFRDPAAVDLGAFYFAELINTGQMVGPRAYTTGEHLLPPLVNIQNLADAMHVVQLQKDLGAVALKEYDQPTRWQRELMAEAARRQSMRITAEGNIDYKNNLGMLIDGYTATEHLWAYHPLYGDVAQLMAKTGFYYDPTIGTAAAGSEHWYRRMNVDLDPKQAHFLLHSDREHLWRRILGQKIAPEWDTVYWSAVRSAARMLNGGARLAVGSHDEPTPTGLGTHWELWSYVDGGMTAMQAIRCGTIGSAGALGMDQDLGSLETGKLADFVVLDANPLEDIHNSIRINRVSRNGFVYDGNTLNLIWPEGRELPALGPAE